MRIEGPVVVTVLRTDPRGIFGPEWVWALKRGLGRVWPGYRFYCLTDVPSIGMWRIPLHHDWPGWWSKVEVFRPGLFEGRVIYMDLDTLLIDRLEWITRYAGPMAFLRDFYARGRPDQWASGMATFTGDEAAFIYDRFLTLGPERVMAAHRGRSDLWYRKVLAVRGGVGFLQDHFPDRIVSLKAHARVGPPKGAAVVCGHGNPRLSQPDAGWAHEEWRRL